MNEERSGRASVGDPFSGRCREELEAIETWRADTDARNLSMERVCKQILGHTKDITDDIQRVDASITALQVGNLMIACVFNPVMIVLALASKFFIW